MKRFAALLLLLDAGFCASAKDTERVQAADGDTIVREFYDDDSLKTVSHVGPDGQLHGTLYYAPKGIPLHLDYFDAQKHVTTSVTYDSDGVPISKRHFDQKDRELFRESYTYTNKKPDDDTLPERDRMVFLATPTKIAFTAGVAWKIIALLPLLPVATVGFQIKNSADEGTPDSTNLGFTLFDSASEDARKKLKVLLGQRAVGKIEKSDHKGWQAFSGVVSQGSTLRVCRSAKDLNVSRSSSSEIRKFASTWQDTRPFLWPSIREIERALPRSERNHPNGMV